MTSILDYENLIVGRFLAGAGAWALALGDGRDGFGRNGAGWAAGAGGIETRDQLTARQSGD
jgi:hypothetical protein